MTYHIHRFPSFNIKRLSLIKKLYKKHGHKPSSLIKSEVIKSFKVSLSEKGKNEIKEKDYSVRRHREICFIMIEILRDIPIILVQKASCEQ